MLRAPEVTVPVALSMLPTKIRTIRPSTGNGAYPLALSGHGGIPGTDHQPRPERERPFAVW